MKIAVGNFEKILQSAAIITSISLWEADKTLGIRLFFLVKLTNPENSGIIIREIIDLDKPALLVLIREEKKRLQNKAKKDYKTRLKKATNELNQVSLC